MLFSENSISPGAPLLANQKQKGEKENYFNKFKTWNEERKKKSPISFSSECINRQVKDTTDVNVVETMWSMRNDNTELHDLSCLTALNQGKTLQNHISSLSLHSAYICICLLFIFLFSVSSEHIPYAVLSIVISLSLNVNLSS